MGFSVAHVEDMSRKFSKKEKRILYSISLFRTLTLPSECIHDRSVNPIKPTNESTSALSSMSLLIIEIQVLSRFGNLYIREL